LKIGLTLILSALVLGGLPGAAALDHARSVVAPSRSIPHPAVVMLWGTWCASCGAEIKRVPALSASARPLPLVTLAIDPPAKAAAALSVAGLSTANAFADDRDPATVLSEWGGKGAILPLAVAIDRNGRVCGAKHGLLGTDQLHSWSKTCLR
jgi:hypothetical protein